MLQQGRRAEEEVGSGADNAHLSLALRADVCVLELVTRATTEFITSCKIVKARPGSWQDGKAQLTELTTVTNSPHRRAPSSSAACAPVPATLTAQWSRPGTSFSTYLSAGDKSLQRTSVPTSALPHDPCLTRPVATSPHAEEERTRQRLLRFALARPDVAFTLVVGTVPPLDGHGGTSAATLPGTCGAAPPPRGSTTLLAWRPGRSMQAAFGSLYGSTWAACLAPLQQRNAGRGGEEGVAPGGDVLLSGLVGTPLAGQVGFPTREASHVFVNGRAVDASCVHSLLDAMFAAAVTALADIADGAAAARGSPAQPAKRRRGGGASSSPGHCPCVVFLTLPRFACDLVPEQKGLAVAFHLETAVLRACADAVTACWHDAGCFADARVRHAVDGAVAAALGRPAPQPLPQQLHHLGKLGGGTACACAGCARPVLSLDAWPRRRRGGATSGATLTLGLGGGIDDPSPAPPPRQEERVAQVCTTAAAFGVVPGLVAAQSLQGARLAACLPGTYLLATDATGCLVAVDQHAADERILLERMHGRAPAAAKAAAVPCRLHMLLSPVQAASLATHAGGLAAWGWAWTAPAHGAGLAEAEVAVTAAPCVEGTVLGEAHFGEWLHSLASLPPPDPPTPSPPPPRVRALLASKACRLAVMFGDALEPHEGSALLRSLARTRQPLRCAHGRPTTVPLAHAAALCAALDAADAAEEAARRQPVGVERARLLLAQVRQ